MDNCIDPAPDPIPWDEWLLGFNQSVDTCFGMPAGEEVKPPEAYPTWDLDDSDRDGAEYFSKVGSPGNHSEKMSACSMDGSPGARKVSPCRTSMCESPPTSIESYKLWKTSAGDSPPTVVARRRGRMGTSDFFETSSTVGKSGSVPCSPQHGSQSSRTGAPARDSLSRVRDCENIPPRKTSSDMRDLHKQLELPPRLKAKISGQTPNGIVTPRYQKLSKVTSRKHSTDCKVQDVVDDKSLPPMKPLRPRSRSLDFSASGELDTNLVAVDWTEPDPDQDSASSSLLRQKLIPSIKVDRSSLPSSTENVSMTCYDDDVLPPARGRSQSQRIYPVSILKCSKMDRKLSTVNRYRKHSGGSHVTFSESPLLIPYPRERRASCAAETVILQLRQEQADSRQAGDGTEEESHTPRSRMVSPPPAAESPSPDEDEGDSNEEKDPEMQWMQRQNHVKRRNSLPPLSPLVDEPEGAGGAEGRHKGRDGGDEGTCEVVHSFTPRPKPRKQKKTPPTRKYSLPGKLAHGRQDEMV